MCVRVCVCLCVCVRACVHVHVRVCKGACVVRTHTIFHGIIHKRLFYLLLLLQGLVAVKLRPLTTPGAKQRD